MRRYNKALMSLILALVMCLSAIPATAVWSPSGSEFGYSGVAVGMSNADPNFTSYALSGAFSMKDYIDTSRTYGYLSNEWLTTLISPNAALNNEPGSISSGTIMDIVQNRTRKSGDEVLRDNTDWTNFALAPTIVTGWSNPNQYLEMPNITIHNDAPIPYVLARGTWQGDSQINTSAKYTLLPGTPIVRIDVTIGNSSSSASPEYFSFKTKFLGAGESFIPGLGWANNITQTGTSEGVWNESTNLTTGFQGNYMFFGKYYPCTGGTTSNAQTSTYAWYKDKPHTLRKWGTGYYNFMYFEAATPAGTSRTITFYYITDFSPAANSGLRPYAYASEWARQIPLLDPYLKAELNTATMSGKVTNTTSQLLSGTTVLLKNSSGTVIDSMVTGADGEYLFSAAANTSVSYAAEATVSGRTYTTSFSFNGTDPYPTSVKDIVVDPSAVAPSITTASASFNGLPSAQADVIINVNMGSGSLVATGIQSITGNGITSNDYTFTGGATPKITFKKEFLSMFSNGNITFMVIFNNAVSTSGNVTIAITGSPSVNILPLNAAIANARTARAGVAALDRPGNEIPASVRYVSIAQMQTLNRAIRAAFNARVWSNSTAEVLTAVGLLNQATENFTLIVKTGER